jgi:hypothetical protein
MQLCERERKLPASRGAERDDALRLTEVRLKNIEHGNEVLNLADRVVLVAAVRMPLYAR